VTFNPYFHCTKCIVYFEKNSDDDILKIIGMEFKTNQNGQKISK